MATQSDTSKIVLISGANRGLGRALTTRFLHQANTTVIAAVRRPDHPTSHSLAEFPRGENSKLITVKIDAVSDTDARDALAYLQSSDHQIDRLDVVVANAGYGSVYGDVCEVEPQQVRDLIYINAVGPLRLFQAAPAPSPPGRQPTSFYANRHYGRVLGADHHVIRAPAYR